MSRELVPVVLFVYRRPDYLRRTLDFLRQNHIPLLIVFCDGLKDPKDVERVEAVKRMIHAIDWCPVRIVERERNLGLGVSIRTGVTEVLSEFESVVVFEDDIDCVPGAYDYMVSALNHYKDDLRVMSVGAFVHPDIRPPLPVGQPHFDGRFTCWGWGTWRRAWKGMATPANTLLWQCRFLRKHPDRYGQDVAIWARNEKKLNIWAVRFLLLHIVNDGLCFHPPHSLTRHAGLDESTTSFGMPDVWQLPDLAPCPPLLDQWPEPWEHPAMAALYQAKCGAPVSLLQRVHHSLLVARWRTGASVRKLLAPLRLK